MQTKIYWDAENRRLVLEHNGKVIKQFQDDLQEALVWTMSNAAKYKIKSFVISKDLMTDATEDVIVERDCRRN